MLVWAAAVTLWAVPTVETFVPLIFPIADPLEAINRPWTFRPVRVPTLVMLGCVAWETTSATFAFATFPTKFEEFSDDRPDPFPNTFETEITLGKSALTRARNEGAPADPMEGPANT